MTLNFFTSENGFQKSLIDPSVTVGTKKDYTTSLKREEFSTSRSKDNDMTQSEQNEKFATMMNDLKNKTGNHDQKETTTPTEARADITVENVKMGLFKTEEAAAPTTLNIVDANAESLNTDINLANIAALNAEIQRLIEDQAHANQAKGDTIVTTKPETEEVESIFALLASFLSQGEKGDKEGETEVTLISVLEKIQDLAQSEGAEAITSGLTPEQLTALQDHIQDYMSDALAQRDQESLEALAAQWVSLNPPIKESAKSTAKTDVQTISATADTPTQKDQKIQTRFDTRYNARYDGNSETTRAGTNQTETTDFKAALKDAGANSDGKATAPAQNNNAQNTGQRFLQTAGLTAQSQAALSDPTATTVQSPLQSSLTNVITQSQSATQAHPATQMVSATIQKAVKAGEDTTIKLKLDPPELGRVEVKMSIDKDNTTKIVLTAEKPETYMMLKQDAEMLERALNDAGLDTKGDLSFELASEDHDFGKDRKQGHSSKQNNSNDIPDEDIIETSMDWQVDQHTGQMHYNVLV
ncbi:MAG: hypothetical protein COB14_05855 [Alphaproteobacteria bacterium]|nr:MAG: hypothetical protein COB14_05855 [Alphaproteobacteria bacterium]